ncbi:MAG: hypothetical protein WB779_11325 [Ignavibacteriaceae bacterium]|jgi:hypothetical protein
MKDLKTFPKILLFFVVLSGALWLGGYFTRLVISYQIFEGTDFTLRNYINDQNIAGILRSFEPAVLTTLVLYLIFIISYILFIITSKVSLKANGWLFIITIIILLTLPFEIYLSIIDYKIIGLLNTTNFNPKDVLNLLIERFKIFGSFPVIEIFCFGAIIFFLLFQPLKKNNITNEN